MMTESRRERLQKALEEVRKKQGSPDIIASIERALRESSEDVLNERW